MPLFGFVSCPFTIKSRGVGAGGGDEAQDPAPDHSLQELSRLLASFSPDQLFSLLVSFMTLTFLESKSLAFCGVSSIWVYLMHAPEIRFRGCFFGRKTTEKWMHVFLSASYQKTHDTCLSHYW